MQYLPILLSVFLCACTAASPAVAQIEPSSKVENTAEFLFDPFEPSIKRSIAYEDAIEKVRSRFGAPEKRTREVGTDHRDPTITAEYLVWYYDGLTIHIQGPVNEQGRWITQIILDGGDYKLKYGLGLNIDRREFLSVLQPALLNDDDRRIRFISSYSDSGVFLGQKISVETNSILLVEFDANGKATKLTWKYYAD